jgi:hypothetical protein
MKNKIYIYSIENIKKMKFLKKLLNNYEDYINISKYIRNQNLKPEFLIKEY